MRTTLKRTYSRGYTSVILLPRMCPLNVLRTAKAIKCMCLVLGIVLLQQSVRLYNISKHVITRETGMLIRNRLESNDYGQKLTHTQNNGSRGANYSIPEVDEFVMKFQLRYNSTNNLLKLNSYEPYDVFLKRWRLKQKKGVPLVRGINRPAKNSAKKYHRGVNQYYMYDPDDGSIQELLKDLSTLPIVSAEMSPIGSQLKFQLNIADGSQARFKPEKHVTDRENRLDSYIMDFFENYQAEIAGFHLDRVLGFHRAVPTVGRVLNMTKDLSSLGADKSVLQHVYRSHTGNLCFIMQCYQYCGQDYPLCGHIDDLPGAVSAGLPPWQKYKRDVKIYPYKGSYRVGRKAPWETDDNYCTSSVKTNASLHMLLEFMDLAAFDFLTGNLDRHDYQVFRDLTEDTFVIMFDNGRGFSQPTYDHMSVLAPLRQCCLIRLSTLAKFIKLYQGPDSLSKLMRSSLQSDPLSPVLTEPHLDALDRRLGKVIKTVSDCLNSARSWEDVIIDDLNIL